MNFRTEGADDLDRIAAALREAGDRDLQKQVSAALRTEAKPLGQEVIRQGADEMPRRGGFADRVRGQSRVGVSNSLRGRTASVQVLLKNKGADLRSLDRGILRHPVFGNRGAWVAQSVPGQTFSRAFEAQVDKARDAAVKGAQAALDDVARKA